MSKPLVKQYCTELYPTDAEDEIGKAGDFAVYEAADVEQQYKDLESRLGMCIRYLANGRIVQAQGLIENTRKALLASLKGQP